VFVLPASPAAAAARADTVEDEDAVVVADAAGISDNDWPSHCIAQSAAAERRLQPV